MDFETLGAHKFVWNNSYVDDENVPIYLINSPDTVNRLEKYVLGEYGDPDKEVIRVAQKALHALENYDRKVGPWRMKLVKAKLVLEETIKLHDLFEKKNYPILVEDIDWAKSLLIEAKGLLENKDA